MDDTKKSRVKHYLKARYDLTLQEYDAMLEGQNRACAICGKHSESMTRRMCIDHDHVTGKVRGLLCTQCNAGLGLFKDNVEHLVSALHYLIDHE